MEPDNAVTKYEVAVMSKDRYFFLIADVSNMTVKINGKFSNKAKEKGIEVLGTITFPVSKHMLSKLKEVL